MKWPKNGKKMAQKKGTKKIGKKIVPWEKKELKERSSTSSQVSLASFSGKEDSSGFADILCTGVTPLDVLGVLLGEDLDLLAVDDQILAILGDGSLPTTVNGVVFEVIDHVVDIHEGLVHCHDVATTAFDGSSADQTTDSTETVDTEVEFLCLHLKLGMDFLGILAFLLFFYRFGRIEGLNKTKKSNKFYFGVKILFRLRKFRQRNRCWGFLEFLGI